MSLNTILATTPLTSTNYVLKATGTTIGNSLIWDNGTNVGIGNQGTTYTLDVSGTLRNTTSAYFGTTSGNIGLGTTTIDTSGGLYTCVTVDSATYSRYSLQSSGVAKGRFQYDATNVSLGSQTTGGKLQLFTSAAYAMEFLTNDTLRMTITSSGQITAIGDFSSGISFDANNAYKINNDNNWAYGCYNVGSSYFMQIKFGGDGTTNRGFRIYNIATSSEVFKITSTGSSFFVGSQYHYVGGARFFAQGGGINYLYSGTSSLNLVNQADTGTIGTFNGTTGVYTASSDINKKKDFEVSTIGLNEILQLKPTLYRFKTEDETAPKQLGFIAQEVQPIIPQAYEESGDEDKKFIGLNFNPIIAALVKGMQEQNQTIQELSNRLIKLESK